MRRIVGAVKNDSIREPAKARGCEDREKRRRRLGRLDRKALALLKAHDGCDAERRRSGSPRYLVHMNSERLERLFGES
jgi:hypothetical protein